MVKAFFNTYACDGCSVKLSFGINPPANLMYYNMPINGYDLTAYIEIHGSCTMLSVADKAIVETDQFLEPDELSLRGFQNVLKQMLKLNKLKNFK